MAPAKFTKVLVWGTSFIWGKYGVEWSYL